MSKKPEKLFKILVFLIMVLVLGQLFLSNSLLSESKNLEKIEREISRLENENLDLKTKTSSLYGFNKLESIASKKGFVAHPPILNLSQKIPVAVKTE